MADPSPNQHAPPTHIFLPLTPHPPSLPPQAGLVTSSALITVSQNYAAEICTTPQEQRIDLLLAQRRALLRGIVNGIDMGEWDPAGDEHIAAAFNADDLSGVWG